MTENAFPDETKAMNLAELAEKYCKHFPVCFKVVAGFCSLNEEVPTIDTDSLYNAHLVKHTEVVTFWDKAGDEYNVPLYSAAKFGIVYNNTQQTFSSVGELMDAAPVPQLVAVRSARGDRHTKPTLEKNEVLVVTEVRKPRSKRAKAWLMVYSVTNSEKKKLPRDFEVEFTTDPYYTKLYITDLLQYVPNLFPCKVHSFEDLERGSLSLPRAHCLPCEEVLLQDKHILKSVVVSKVHESSDDQKTTEFIDVPTSIGITVSVVDPETNKGIYEKLYNETRALNQTFCPTKLKMLIDAPLNNSTYIIRAINYFKALRKVHLGKMQTSNEPSSLETPTNYISDIPLAGNVKDIQESKALAPTEISKVQYENVHSHARCEQPEEALTTDPIAKVNRLQVHIHSAVLHTSEQVNSDDFALSKDKLDDTTDVRRDGLMKQKKQKESLTSETSNELSGQEQTREHKDGPGSPITPGTVGDGTPVIEVCGKSKAGRSTAGLHTLSNEERMNLDIHDRKQTQGGIDQSSEENGSEENRSVKVKHLPLSSKSSKSQNHPQAKQTPTTEPIAKDKRPQVHIHSAVLHTISEQDKLDDTTDVKRDGLMKQKRQKESLTSETSHELSGQEQIREHKDGPGSPITPGTVGDGTPVIEGCGKSNAGRSTAELHKNEKWVNLDIHDRKQTQGGIDQSSGENMSEENRSVKVKQKKNLPSSSESSKTQKHPQAKQSTKQAKVYKEEVVLRSEGGRKTVEENKSEQSKHRTEAKSGCQGRTSTKTQPSQRLLDELGAQEQYSTNKKRRSVTDAADTNKALPVNGLPSPSSTFNAPTSKPSNLKRNKSYPTVPQYENHTTNVPCVEVQPKKNGPYKIFVEIDILEEEPPVKKKNTLKKQHQSYQPLLPTKTHEAYKQINKSDKIPHYQSPPPYTRCNVRKTVSVPWATGSSFRSASGHHYQSLLPVSPPGEYAHLGTSNKKKKIVQSVSLAYGNSKEQSLHRRTSDSKLPSLKPVPSRHEQPPTLIKLSTSKPNLAQQSNEQGQGLPAVTVHNTGSRHQELALLSIDEVQLILDALGLQQYKPLFYEESIDGEILQELDEEILSDELSINCKEHRVKLMKVINGEVSPRTLISGTPTVEYNDQSYSHYFV